MTPLLGLKETPMNFMAIFGALLLSHAVLNHVGIRVVARLNDFSAVYHVAGVAIVVLALAFFAPKQPITWIFTETFTTIKDQPYWLAFLGGLLQAQWTYTGYDASAHTIEETKNARVSAPWGIYLSVAISGIFGYLMLAFVTLAIKDLRATSAAGNPFIFIMEQALGEQFGRVVLWVVTFAMWFCGLSCVTSTSRMIFAFSRDHRFGRRSAGATERLPRPSGWPARSRSFCRV
jgi:amino acid transporter